MKENGCVVLKSPIGWIVIRDTVQGISEVALYGYEKPQICEHNTPWLRMAIKELEEYFAGKRTVFTVPLDLKGTTFQKKVWSATQLIPYGKTRTYGQLAQDIGNKKASQAVGQAMGHNPVAIIVTCHRVVSASGLGGFQLGYKKMDLDIKQRLISLERIALSQTG